MRKGSICSQENEQSKLIDIQSVAQMLGCSPRHVNRLAGLGKLPSPVKLGSLTRWSKSAIDKWISDGCPGCNKEVQ